MTKRTVTYIPKFNLENSAFILNNSRAKHQYCPSFVYRTPLVGFTVSGKVL